MFKEVLHLKMKIIRNYELGSGVQLKAAIDDGIAIIISNCATEWRKIYFQCKKDGKNVIWDYRKNAMIEYFEGKTAEEIEGLLAQDYKTAKHEQKKAMKYAEAKK